MNIPSEFDLAQEKERQEKRRKELDEIVKNNKEIAALLKAAKLVIKETEKCRADDDDPNHCPCDALCWIGASENFENLIVAIFPFEE